MRLLLTECALTGRANVRVGWFGRLIPQVEVRRLEYSACPPLPGVSPRDWEARIKSQGARTTYWRDATWEDFRSPLELSVVARGQIPPRSMLDSPRIKEVYYRRSF